MTSSSAPTPSAATAESAPALRLQDRIGAGLQALRYPAFVLAITAGFLAASEGRLHDSKYVKRLAYQWNEEGAFAEEAKARKSAS